MPPTKGDNPVSKPRNWDDPNLAREARGRIRTSLRAMSRDPKSGIKLCHAQGKAAIYLSADGDHIVTEHPNGDISSRSIEEIRREAQNA